MTEHTRPGGLVIIEPFLPNASYAQTKVRHRSAVDDKSGMVVSRVSTKRPDSNAVRAHTVMHYIFGKKLDDGRVEPMYSFAEEQTLGIYPLDFYRALFKYQGLFSNVSLVEPLPECPTSLPVLVGTYDPARAAARLSMRVA